MLFAHCVGVHIPAGAVEGTMCPSQDSPGRVYSGAFTNTSVAGRLSIRPALWSKQGAGRAQTMVGFSVGVWLVLFFSN